MVETRSNSAAATGPLTQPSDSSATNLGSLPEDSIPVLLAADASAEQWRQYSTRLEEFYQRRKTNCETKHREQTIQLEAKRDILLRQSTMQQPVTSANASSAVPAAPKPVIIKIQGKTPETYSGGSYLKFDNYIIEMEQQFVLNNVYEREDFDAQKISYAVTFLKDTPKLSWLAAVRDETANIVWTEFKKFLAIRSQNSATFTTDTYDRWQSASQMQSQKAADYIAYLDRQASYLSDNLRPNKAVQMKWLATSLIPDLSATLATKTPYPTTYKDMKKQVLILEDNARVQQKILCRSGRTAAENSRSKRARHRNSEGEDHEAEDNTSFRGQHTRGRRGGRRGQRRQGSRGQRGQGFNHQGRGQGRGNIHASGANKTKASSSAKRTQKFND